MMCGGFTNEQPMDAEIMARVNAMRPQIEARAGMKYAIFVPVSYASQMVAGINYRVRVAVDGGHNLFVTLFEDLPCNGGNCSITAVDHA